MSNLSKSAFHSEPQAFEYLEKTLWPDGAVCPHCGVDRERDQIADQGRDGKRRPDRAVEMQRQMPQAVHGQGRDRIRAWPYPAA